MSQQTKSSGGWVSVLPSLIVPVCFGMSLYIGMLALIRQGTIDNETVLRYLTGHPVSKVSLAMFFIGGSSLMMIALNVFAQFTAERQIGFREPTDFERDQRQSSDDAELAVELGQQLLDYPASLHSHYLWQRLTNALHFVYRNGSAAGVDDEIKYQADLDLERQQQRYSLVRILIWATPMLGFLGTVLGISQALGGISVGPDNDFQQMMDGLRGSLYVAFDTTALALTLSMLLMFAQFLVDRFETQLLSIVDRRARSEIAAQYDSTSSQPSATNDLAASVKHLGQEMLSANREMVAAQTAIWKKTIHAAENAWSSSISQTNEQVRKHLSDSIERTVLKFGTCMDESIDKADNSMTRRWKQWQVMLSDNARLLCEHQAELAQQTTAIERIIDKSGDRQQFADALEKNGQVVAATASLEESIRELADNVKQIQQQEPEAIVLPLAQAFEQALEARSAADAEAAAEIQAEAFAAIKPEAEVVARPNSTSKPNADAEVILPRHSRTIVELPLRMTKRTPAEPAQTKQQPMKKVA